MSENLVNISKGRESIGIGSIVELKSGGPPMTVKSRTPDEVYVIWHDAEGHIFQDMIPLACVKVR